MMMGHDEYVSGWCRVPTYIGDTRIKDAIETKHVFGLNHRLKTEIEDARLDYIQFRKGQIM